MKRDASWVVVEKATGKAVLETFNPKVVAALNTTKYEAVPVLDYLVALNQRIAKERTK